MPYNVDSAYAAQEKLKKSSPAYKKSSGFKMKGSPMKDTKNDPDYDKVHQRDVEHITFSPTDIRHKRRK